MLIVSARTLNILAALVWVVGGAILLVKGVGLLAEAKALEPAGPAPLYAGVAGVVAGAIKARYLFSSSCEKNLKRIAALKEPRIWQFFRGRFLFILVVVIILSSRLSRLSHGNYTFLMLMGALDLSISTALLASSPVYIRERAFSMFRH